MSFKELKESLRNYYDNDFAKYVYDFLKTDRSFKDYKKFIAKLRDRLSELISDNENFKYHETRLLVDKISLYSQKRFYELLHSSSDSDIKRQAENTLYQFIALSVYDDSI